jgi:hypothetical protein
MWFFMVQAIPKSSSKKVNAFERAVIHCWINFPEPLASEHLVHFYLDREGWMITNVEFSEWVDIDGYMPVDEGFDYACEAEKSGSSFLFQTYLADNSK